jgi:hypothetical protein
MTLAIVEPGTARKCEVCGRRQGAISCYRTLFAKMGLKKSYAHKACFERVRTGRRVEVRWKADPAAHDAPQNGHQKRHDGTRIRHDGFEAVPAHSPKPVPPDRRIPCKRESCEFHTLRFAPKRPNQEYHDESCRKKAHLERRAFLETEPLRAVLDDLAALPATLGDAERGRPDVLYSKVVELAERAASALHEHAKGKR